MASSGSRSGDQRMEAMSLARLKREIENKEKELKREIENKEKELRAIGTGSQSYPTPPLAHAANKPKEEYSKKTGPGHEAKGAGGDGGGDGGQGSGGERLEAMSLARLKRELENKKKELRAIGTGSQSYPTPPPAHAANKEKNKYSKKTGPGHEAKGAGGDGGGDGGRDGGDDDGKPKEGFTFCLICRSYILSEDFDEHVRQRHPAA